MYCNFGDINNPNNEAFDIGDTSSFRLTYAFSIHFNIEHVHSDNYNTLFNSNYHLSSCPCGYSEYKTHYFMPYGTTIGKCKYCHETCTLDECCFAELDPTGSLTLGTMVTIYGGNTYSSNIVVGYTRIAYLTGSSPSQSRLDYCWFTTNSNIVDVTKYGTILAKHPGNATIYFVYKSDPSKVGSINVTISNDTSYVVRYITLTTDIRGGSLNGTEVTQNSGLPNGLTIHNGYTRAICFATINSYPSINNFIWMVSSSTYLSIDKYGYVYAQNVNTNVSADVICVSRYNSYLMGRITLQLLP